MISSRRGFLVGLATSLLAAPAIVRAASLMPVRQMPPAQTLEELLKQRMDDAYAVMAQHMRQCLYGDLQQTTRHVARSSYLDAPYGSGVRHKLIPFDVVFHT